MNIAVDFPLILTLLVLISGLIALVDLIFFAKKRKAKQAKMSKVVEYARSFFPVLLIVWVIRSFLIQPYHVPTGSLEPTIMPGDFIAVNQFSYGLRLPVLNYKFLKIGEPARGDIALFRWPVNPKQIFVKRVIGLPGDHIVYRNKILRINGQIARQNLIGHALDIEPNAYPIPVEMLSEDLLGKIHEIYQRKSGGFTKDFDVVVPDGEYFMMGDNRDDSDDSRDWGFVPEQFLVGKAMVIWFSWDSERNSIRWHRIGKLIK